MLNSLQQPTRSTSKNIVVFGESGVGKSSLINLIAGRSIAETSSSAKGCTFQHKKYELQLEDTPYAIWDTAGLDEGAFGTVPAEIAEENLKQLLRDLSKANGIHLLLYCVRASRLRKALLGNYNLFYSAMCRKKVPIVAVVTGLENYEGEMQDWWAANKTEFASLKMHFDGHACVTTLNVDKVNSPVLKQRCLASRQAVLDLIARVCPPDQWRTEHEHWTSVALPDVRAMFRPTRHNGSQPTPVVALYDLPDRLGDPIGSAKDASPFEGGRLMDLGGSPLLIYRIHDRQLRAGARFKKHMSPRGADLLVFCASVHADPGAVRERVVAFYSSYGGETRPLLIVVKDALSDEAAIEWWSACDGDDKQHDTGGLHAIVRALPPPATDAEVVVAALRRTIQTRALQPVDAVPTGCFNWLSAGKRSVKLRSENAGSIFVEEDCLTRSSVWTPWFPRRP